MLYLTFSSQTEHINKLALRLHTLQNSHQHRHTRLTGEQRQKHSFIDIFYRSCFFITFNIFFFFVLNLAYFRKSKIFLNFFFADAAGYFTISERAYFLHFPPLTSSPLVIILDGNRILNARLLPHVKTEPPQQTSK